MTDYLALKSYSYRLYLNFIKSHIKSQNLIPSKEEEDCVKAFCVLIHAAIEEYIETLALQTIKKACKKFKSKQFITKIPSGQPELDSLNNSVSQLIKTLLLSSAYSIHANTKSDALKNYVSKMTLADNLYRKGSQLTQDDIVELTKKTDSYAKEIVKEAVKFFDGHVEGNHGASVKYLLKLLIPVGIDIPEELSLLNSLQKLAEFRGTYAHTQGNLTNILSASDSVKYIADAIKLCGILDKSIEEFHLYAETPAVSSLSSTV